MTAQQQLVAALTRLFGEQLVGVYPISDHFFSPLQYGDFADARARAAQDGATVLVELPCSQQTFYCFDQQGELTGSIECFEEQGASYCSAATLVPPRDG